MARSTALQVGSVFTSKHMLRQEDFNRFAALSGDDNPIHVDPVFSARTTFGKTVAHGMFLYGLIDSAARHHLPGAVPVSQDLMFPCPSFVGEQVTISLKVVEIRHDERVVRLATLVTRPGGEIGCQGEMLVQWTGK